MAAQGQIAADRLKVEGSRPARNGVGRDHRDLRRQADGREQVADIQRARMLAAMVDVVAERGVGNVTV